MERGHRAVVYTTEAYAELPPTTLRRMDREGLEVWEAVHNNRFASFEESYHDPLKLSQLSMVLDEVRPDLVHVQHLHQHGLGALDLIDARGIPIAYTLHEFWLLCVHNGWLAKPGWELCQGPEPQACAACAQTCMPPPEAGREPSDWLAAWKARDATVRAALQKVALFVSPSKFVRERFVASGLIDAQKIIYSDNGQPERQALSSPARQERAPTQDRQERGPLRIGFLGTIAEWKGVHLLIEAVNQLSPAEARLDLWGVLEYFPDYVAKLRAQSSHPGIHFHDRYDNARVLEILADMDVLVVPSLWYENSPLTIHEAFQAGTAVLTADQGGMREYVEHEVDGLHFRMHDADDLLRQLRRLIDEDGLLERLTRGIRPLKSIASDVLDWEARYEQLIAGAQKRAARR